MWYFCYGANMSSRILVDRRSVQPISSEIAHLEDHKLEFAQPGIPIIEPAFATPIPSAEHKVFGVLHNIPPDRLAAIDSFEGPEYERIEIAIQGTKSGEVNAWTYFARNPQVGLKPSQRYVNLLLEGAQEFGLPEEYIEILKNQATSPAIPLIAPLLPTLFRLAEKIATNNTIAQRTGYLLLKLLGKLNR